MFGCERVWGQGQRGRKQPRIRRRPCASHLIRFLHPLISEPRTSTLRPPILSPMRVYPYIFSFYAFTDVATALYLGRWCPIACDTTLNYATFNDTNLRLSKKVRSCQSNFRINSLYLCFDEYCDGDGKREEWIREQSSWCDKHAGVKLPSYHEVVDRWKPDARKGVKRWTADEAMKWPALDEIVIPDADFFARAFTTMVWLLSLSLARLVL